MSLDLPDRETQQLDGKAIAFIAGCQQACGFDGKHECAVGSEIAAAEIERAAVLLADEAHCIVDGLAKQALVIVELIAGQRDVTASS